MDLLRQRRDDVGGETPERVARERERLVELDAADLALRVRDGAEAVERRTGRDRAAQRAPCRRRRRRRSSGARSRSSSMPIACRRAMTAPIASAA